MIKIIASILTLSLAFAAGVILGAHQNKPKIKKIASQPISFKSAPVKKTTPFKEVTANINVKAETTKPNEASDLPNKFLNKKRTGYTVLLSSFKVEENANNYAEKISKKGYDAFYFSKEIQGKTWHRVGVGSFSTKSTAESLKKQLIENRLGKGSLISTIPSGNSI